MRNLTLKQLKAIQAITGHGKIVNAAKALGLTPPAVTIQLKQLEEDVGLALFDRTQDGMRLTAAGRAVVDTAQAIEERLRLLEDQIDAIKGVRALRQSDACRPGCGRTAPGRHPPPTA